VLEVGDFALAVGFELDDIGLEEEVEVTTDTRDIAVEVVGEATDRLDVSLSLLEGPSVACIAPPFSATSSSSVTTMRAV
jgi:hypothetical protein